MMNIHKRHPKMLILMGLLIFTAGCVSQLTLPQFGSDVVGVVRQDESPGLYDIALLENVRTLPEAQALPGQSVRFFANIISKEQDPARLIENVFLEIFDATQFRTDDGSQLCNNALTRCQPDICYKGGNCKLRAGETKALEVEMQTPSSTDIANVKTPARLNYRLVYDHASTTNFEILVVSNDEILRLQQEGKKLSQPIRHTSNAGPVQIQLDTPSGFGIPGQRMFVTLKIANLGSGSPTGTELPSNSVTITFPEGLGSVEPPGEFIPSGNKFTNNEAIKLVKGESIPYQFKITVDQNSLAEGTPHKTFLITSSAAYKYELRGMHTVEILPER